MAWGASRRSAANAGIARCMIPTPITHASPPPTIEKRTLVSAASAPASRSPSAGPLATTVNSRPESRPTRCGGAAVWRMVWRKIALIMSAPPAMASATTANQRTSATPNRASDSPHADDGEVDGEALLPYLAGPPTGERCEERAGRGGRVEDAENGRPAEAACDRGEEGIRHPEDHRDDVDDERALQHGTSPQESESFKDAAGVLFRSMRWDRPDQEDAPEDEDEADRVDHVRTR